MKLWTLNTHSLVEVHYSEKLSLFASGVAEEQPDIIALQEVNQTIAEPFTESVPDGYVPCASGVKIRRDNHVYQAARQLRSLGVEYYWTWLPLKRGYDKYDEGIALMSRSKILETKVLKVSKTEAYDNWKTRKIVGIRTQQAPEEWFFSVHYGWWNDEEESFQEQWKRTAEALNDYPCVWLMGDFNSPAEVRGEGYDLIKQDGWHDCYALAKAKDSGITVGAVIDGWKDKISGTDGMRIDQIWCRKKQAIADSRVIFNGKNRAVVSDHYGVMISDERRENR